LPGVIYDVESKGSHAYRALAGEILKKHAAQVAA